ncbi:ZntA Cation transport ATPase [Candidatus Nanopelagicaceae bacterium]
MIYTFKISGMTCSSCVNSIEGALNSIPGVKATVNFATESVHVSADEDVTTKSLIAAIKSAGYAATLVSDPSQLALHSKRSGLALALSILFAVPAIAISMVMSWHHSIDMFVHDQLDTFGLPHPLYSPTAWVAIALTAPVILIVAFPIHRAAFNNFLIFINPKRDGALTMDNLVSLGSLTAFGWSIYANSTGTGDVYTEVAAGVLLFVILGRYLEARAKSVAGSALQSLLELGSKEVVVLRSGQEVIIPITNLQVGDEFVVKPGERIATDGVVISGTSAVDNSMITGESLPIEVNPGSKVIGATLNHNGRIVVKATRVGDDTELARITAMVLSAQGGRSPIQTRVNKISSIFVPVVTLLSVATGLAWYLYDSQLTHAIATGIAVLVIACPCALGLATPVALMVASGRGAQRGIVVSAPSALEAARGIDRVLLDKTGTLTTGKMKVSAATVSLGAAAQLAQIYPELIKEATILSSALSIESQNTHPVGLAIADYVSAQGIKATTVSDYSVSPGNGAAGRVNLGMHSPVVLIGSPAAVAHSTVEFHPEIKAAINAAQSESLTISVLAWDSVALAVFSVGDEIKSDAAQTISKFKELGISPWLVTGDSPGVAHSVALKVGIDISQVTAAATPETKLAAINNLQDKGHKVLMIGDGINDAAALAAADLSMAMGTGTDTAIAAADITLMRTDLTAAIDALQLSERTIKIIKGNLTWAFAYNVVGIPIAAAGFLNPMYGAAAMALSSVFVVTNSLRIR